MAYPIDTASLDLIAKLQLEDAESLLKGKHAGGTQPDAEYAAQLLRDELEQIRISIADNAMCRSIVAAVLADSDAIQSSLGEEQQATRDREYATHLDSMDLDSDDADLANVLPHKYSSEPHIDDEMIGKLATLFVDDGELPGPCFRCSSCHHVVELSTGCNHISCRCGAQFCYVCGEKWKTCGCQQWHENRLLDRANAVVDRDINPELDDAERAVRMEQEQQNLRDNHKCRHETWRVESGAFQCEESLDHLPQYIYECVNCRILACRICRRNRL
ncbi:hypothetical protein ACQRIU_003314 [Beauveria bassiana]